MERIINAVPGPIRRYISRGLSFPTLPTLGRFGSSNGNEPLPSAGKRQREASDDEDEGGPKKRVKMDVDEPPSSTVTEGAETPSTEQIRPGVEALSLAPGTPPPNGNAKSVTSSPSTPSKRGKYQRGLRGTRKTGTNEAPTPSKPRLGPKRQCAMLISFCGTGYSGMQIQKGAKTIEGTIFEALVKIGSVSEDNSDDATKVNIQRAARTDAGVHAARNVISIKVIMDLPGIANLVSHLNEHLPPEIRVWDIIRTQNSFNSRTSCDSRRYSYCLPSYLLLPPSPESHTAKALQSTEDGSYDPSQHSFWADVAGKPITQETTLFSLRQKYRIDEETLTRFNNILQEYIGTHNFWNFTVGRDFKEAAAKRLIKSIEVKNAGVYGNGEWLAVEIHGQSFMLHQRKMIALAVFLTRSQSPPSLVSKLYESTRIRVPKAPALGLMLEEPVYESYNKKVAVANAKWKDVAPQGKGKGAEAEDDVEHQSNFIRDPMDFSKFKDPIEEFKNKYIYEAMVKQEDEQGSFEAWLTAIDNHEARLFYEVRGMPVPSELGVPTKPSSKRLAAKDDGDESDDALGKGKVNFKSVELEG